MFGLLFYVVSGLVDFAGLLGLTGLYFCLFGLFSLLWVGCYRFDFWGSCVFI